jgi:pimeloyl-ACP methyl ester carboxylesterase
MSYTFWVYTNQESFLYQPSHPPQFVNGPPQYFRNPGEYGLQYQDLMIKTIDGKEISAWFIPAHRFDGKTKPLVPIINTTIAQSILNRFRKLNDVNGDSLEEIHQGSESGDNNQGDGSDLSEKQHKERVGAQKSKDYVQHNKEILNECQKMDINRIFAQSTETTAEALTASSTILPTSTYDLSAVVTNPNNQIEQDVANILWFHGNAGNIAQRLPNLFHLVTSQSANVLIVDYRGYGHSSNCQPTEEGLVIDAVSAFCYLQSRVDINPTTTAIFGQSLGSAVTIALAAAIEVANESREKRCMTDKEKKEEPRQGDNDKDGGIVNNKNYIDQHLFDKNEPNTAPTATKSITGVDIVDIVSPHLVSIPPPCGIIIENTFTSILNLADFLFPYLPFRWLWVRLQWQSLDRIKRIKTIPALFLCSEDDEIIPVPMMEDLYHAVPHQNKALHIVYDSFHDNAWSRGGVDYCTKIQLFLQYSVAKEQNIATLTRTSRPNERVPRDRLAKIAFRSQSYSFAPKLIQPTWKQKTCAIKKAQWFWWQLDEFRDYTTM